MNYEIYFWVVFVTWKNLRLACDTALKNKRCDENTHKSHRITEKIKISLVIMFTYAKYGGELIRTDKPIF